MSVPTGHPNGDRREPRTPSARPAVIIDVAATTNGAEATIGLIIRDANTGVRVGERVLSASNVGTNATQVEGILEALRLTNEYEVVIVRTACEVCVRWLEGAARTRDARIVELVHAVLALATGKSSVNIVHVGVFGVCDVLLVVQGPCRAMSKS